MKDSKILVSKNIKWIVTILSFVGFILLSIAVLKNKVGNFDNLIYDKISLLISDKMTIFVRVITSFGSAAILIGITIGIMLIFKNKKHGILIGINLLSVFLFNLLLKFIYARPRPIDINLVEEGGCSFPSGHAMVSTAFYGFLIYLIFRSNINNKVKWLYSILLSLLIISICITRVYLGVHFASDVLGGMIIAIAYLIIFVSISFKYLPNKKSSK